MSEEEAERNKPKRPLNFYMRFRMERLNALKGDEDRTEKVKAQWTAVPAAKMQEEAEKYKKAMSKYTDDMEKWRVKYNVKKSKKKTEKDRSSSPSPRKGEKTKGKPKEDSPGKKKKSQKDKDAEKEENLKAKAQSKGDKHDKIDKKSQVDKSKPKKKNG